MIKLSASTLNLFLECPRCFWLRIKKGIKRPERPLPSITQGMDSIIKEYFNFFREKKILPPFLEKKLSAKLIESLPKSLYYQPPQSDFLLWGKLDECIVFQDNTYAALDHKTRGSAPQSVHDSFKFQMDVYTLLLEENGYKTKKKAVLVYYYPIKAQASYGFDFEIDVHIIDTNPEFAKEVFERAIKVLESDVIPESSPNCEFCKWIRGVKSYF